MSRTDTMPGDLRTPAPDQGDPMTGDLHLSSCMCAVCRSADREAEASETDGTLTSDSSGLLPAVATLGEMADFLTTGYRGDSTPQRHNVAASGIDANDGVLYYNLSGYDTAVFGSINVDSNGVSAARAELIRQSFDIYEAVLGIDFVEVDETNGAHPDRNDHTKIDFFFADNDGGAYAQNVNYGDNTIYASYINVAAGWFSGKSGFNTYTLQTYLHEIGHALGLGHQGAYNATPGVSITYSAFADYQLDSWQATMMSYFSQTENTAVVADRSYLQTPMAVDWIALDDIYAGMGYGIDGAFAGDTTYGFNTTISASESEVWNQFSSYANLTASTIVDGSGTDTLDVSGYGADQKIDLTIQTEGQTYQNTSDIGGKVGNLTLAIGTVVENATAGTGNDVLIGNTADNTLAGGAGNDTLNGGAGNDDLDGGIGTDTAVFALELASYTVSVLDAAIEVVGEGIDLVRDTIETLQFASTFYTFDEIEMLFGVVGPNPADDTARVAEDAAVEIDVLDNDDVPLGDILFVSEVEGAALTVGASISLSSGATVTLNGDGTLSYDTNGAFDTLRAGQSAEDSFTYTANTLRGGAADATVTVTVDGVDPVPVAIGEAGTVATRQNGEEWHDVTFEQAIENAVVVMGPLTMNGGDPAVTRVRNVTDLGFQFKIDEWDYLDNVHDTETVGWLAVSEGSHELATGQTIVAGTQEIDTDPEAVAFGETMDDAIVLSQVTSARGSDTVTTRMRNVTSDGFKVRLQEQEAYGWHKVETVSWVAVETGLGLGIEAIKTGTTLDEKTDSFDFVTSFVDAPVILADMQTTRGGDTAALRMLNPRGDGVSLFVQEERSADNEVNHNDEGVGILALSDGLIYA